MRNLTDMLVDWENGQISEVDSIKLFSHLIKTGIVWKLQGFYGRAAFNLIDSQVLDKKGNILIDLEGIYE